MNKKLDKWSSLNNQCEALIHEMLELFKQRTYAQAKPQTQDTHLYLETNAQNIQSKLQNIQEIITKRTKIMEKLSYAELDMYELLKKLHAQSEDIS